MPWIQVTSRGQLRNFLCGGERSPCTPSCGTGCWHGDHVPGDQFLVLKSAHGKYLTAGISTWTDRVENKTTSAKNDEKFFLDFLDNCKIAIRTSANTYWSAQQSGKLMADRKVIGEWEKFTLYVNEDETKFAIKTWNNKWISAQPDGRMEANRTSLDSWETFTGQRKDIPCVRVKSRQQLRNFLSGGERSPCTPSCGTVCWHGDHVPGDEFLILKSTHGKYLTAGISTWTDRVENKTTSAKNDEKFSLDFLDNCKIAIRTSANTYWSAQQSGKLMADRKSVDEWEKFILYVNEDETKLAIKTWNNKWVSAQPDGRMEANRTLLDAWEIFTRLPNVPCAH